MNTAAKGERVRWIWAAGGAAAMMGGLVFLFGLTRPPVAPPVMEAAKAAMVFDRLTSDSALNDRATALDPKPLFLPTSHVNAAQKEIAWPDPGGTFQSYRIRPKFSFADSDLKLDLPAPVSTPAKPADALTADAPGALALGFGRLGAEVAPLPARGAAIRIVATDSGLPALPVPAMAEVEKLVAEARPPGEQGWKPVTFLASVDPAGLVGSLVIVEPRSGVEAVDNYFKNYLERTLRLGERLKPGFYRISVGP